MATLEAFAETVQVDLPSGAPRKLLDLARLLETVAVTRGFISPGDAGRVLERHVLDALKGATALHLDLLPGARGAPVVDVGSGAGIPGLPLAIALPEVPFELVEPRQARVAFIEAAIDRLGVTNAVARHGRIEGYPPQTASDAVARAFAPLPRAWPVIRPALGPGRRLIFYAGVRTAIPEALPGASGVQVVSPPAHSVLASSGPLIIITAQ